MTQTPVSPVTVPPAIEPQLRFRGARSVAALILREMSTTYGRNPGGYIWAILQPTAVIAILSLAFSFMLRSPALGTSFLLFYATGFLTLRMFQDVCQAATAAISFNRSLLAYPRVTYVDTICARLTLAVLTQIMVSTVVLTGVIIYDDIKISLEFGPIVEAYALAVLLAAGVGTFNSYMTVAFPVYKTLWTIVTRPLMLVSGIFYIYEGLPMFAQNLLWFNPLIHLTALARTGFYSTYSPTFISIPYVVFFALVPMFFGFLLLYRYSKDILYK